MTKTPRRILAVLCLLAAVFFLLPLGIGILHFGMVWPAALLLLCAAWLTWPDFFRRLLRPKWLRALVGCVIAVCMTAILVTLGKMAMAAADRPADGQDCTVVVLGCQVFPDGHPSLMLRGRINAAYDYLTAHPDACASPPAGRTAANPSARPNVSVTRWCPWVSRQSVSCWKTSPPPPKKTWPSPPRCCGRRACPRMWPSPRTTSTSCVPPSGRSAAD